MHQGINFLPGTPIEKLLDPALEKNSGTLRIFTLFTGRFPRIRFPALGCRTRSAESFVTAESFFVSGDLMRCWDGQNRGRCAAARKPEEERRACGARSPGKSVARTMAAKAAVPGRQRERLARSLHYAPAGWRGVSGSKTAKQGLRRRKPNRAWDCRC